MALPASSAVIAGRGRKVTRAPEAFLAAWTRVRDHVSIRTSEGQYHRSDRPAALACTETPFREAEDLCFTEFGLIRQGEEWVFAR